MRKIVTFFIHNEVMVNLFILLLFVFGTISIARLTSSFFPHMDTQFIIVEAVYPGASPVEVEEGITQKVEENLKGLQGIDRVTSTSRENSALIRIELLPKAEPNEVLQEVRNAVDRIASFPPEMERIVIYEEENLNFTAKVAIAGNAPLQVLKEKAQEVEDELRDFPNISKIELNGFPEEEIEIAVQENLLRAYNLTFQDIARAVRNENLNITGGTIRTGKKRIIVRADSKEYQADALRDIIVKSDSIGSLVKLHTVADLKNTWSETPNEAYYNGQRAVLITINTRNEEDILNAAESIRQYIKTFNHQNEKIRAHLVDDYTTSLNARIGLMEKNGAIGALLVLIMLGIFLRPRVAFWVALGIPISFMGMFILGAFSGLTINVLSLFGMILVIGILVDDGVVIGENIFQHFEDGEKPFTAAINGTLEVMPSIIAAITTTCIAFGFFFFIEGQLGAYFSDISFVVIASLAVSLIEVSLFLPSHLAHSKDLQKSYKEGRLKTKISNIMFKGRDKLYQPVLKFVTTNRLFFFLIAVSLLVFTVAGVGAGIVRTTFFPEIEQNVVNVSLEMSAGTSENVTREKLQQIARQAKGLNSRYWENPDQTGDVVKNVEIIVGPTPNEGKVNVYLQEAEFRAIRSFEIASDIRQAVGNIPNSETLSFVTESPFGKPISISLSGNNYEELRAAKGELKTAMQSIGGLKDIVDSDKEDQPEVDVKLLQNAKLLGLSLGEVIAQVRNGFFGQEVQRLQRGDDEVKVWVRYDSLNRNELNDLRTMRIRTPDGDSYPLEEISAIEKRKGLIAIEHLDGNRRISVESEVTGNASAPEVLDNIRATIIPDILKRHPGVSVVYEGQYRQGNKLFSSIAEVGPVILILMFSMLVITFRSFGQALALLAVIPFGIIGSVWGHFIHNMPVSLLSLLGFIALIGILFNDGLVLIQTLNGKLKRGEKYLDAVVNTGLSRFRPLVLTTITTVAGLAPLILETSMQAQFLIPMAVTVAYGLILGSFFTATLLPVFLLTINAAKVRTKQLWTGHKPSHEEVERAVKEKKEREENE